MKDAVNAPINLADAFEQALKNERGRLRGINHLSSTLAAWDEMESDDRYKAVAMALDRLENPW